MTASMTNDGVNSLHFTPSTLQRKVREFKRDKDIALYFTQFFSILHDLKNRNHLRLRLSFDPRIGETSGCAGGFPMRNLSSKDE
ncbi:hypothetical protein BSNK01_25080 [Bacillaceae bacterium]